MLPQLRPILNIIAEGGCLCGTAESCISIRFIQKNCLLTLSNFGELQC